MRRLIFLDVDGVLNHHATRHRVDGLRGFDPECIARLNTLAEKTGASIVLSSTWRLLFGTDRTQAVMRQQGWTGPRFIGETPELFLARGHEIQKWLDDNPGDGKTSFVILDDCEDMAHLAHRLVRTDERVGLTEENVEQALMMFGLFERESAAASP